MSASVRHGVVAEGTIAYVAGVDAADIAAAKRALRAELRAARAALPDAQRSAERGAAVRRCAELIARVRPRRVASYLALPGELDLGELHAELIVGGLGLLVPRVAGPGRLVFHLVRDPAEARPGAFGVPEPDPARCATMELDAATLLLVPGLGFGADGRRLGQGGGFYDRVLATFAGTAVGVGYSCQRRDDLPVEAHDRRLGGVVLGDRVLRDPLGLVP